MTHKMGCHPLVEMKNKEEEEKKQKQKKHREMLH